MGGVAREIYHGGAYPIGCLKDNPVAQTNRYATTPTFIQEAHPMGRHGSHHGVSWNIHTMVHGFSAGFTMVQDGVPNPYNVDGASDLRDLL